MQFGFLGNTIAETITRVPTFAVDAADKHIGLAAKIVAGVAVTAIKLVVFGGNAVVSTYLFYQCRLPWLRCGVAETTEYGAAIFENAERDLRQVQPSTASVYQCRSMRRRCGVAETTEYGAAIFENAERDLRQAQPSTAFGYQCRLPWP